MTTRFLLAVTTVACCLATADAGFYVPGEPFDIVSRNGKIEPLAFDPFRLRFGDIKGIGIAKEQPSALRKQYLGKRDELKSLRRPGFEELVRLGGYYYRLGDLENAFATWHKASQIRPPNYLAFSNLSLVLMMRGELLEARRFQADAPAMDLKSLPGITPELVKWFARVEVVMRNLLRMRNHELREKIPLMALPLDDLFGVQFVGDSGRYEPGQISAAQREKLPEDAITIVQQLLLWMPSDARLYWLLAELYNAAGEMQFAVAIMDECVNTRFQTELLREHQQLIGERLAAIREEAEKNEARIRAEHENKDFRRHPEVVWAAGIAGLIVVVLLVVWQLRLIARRWAR